MEVTTFNVNETPQHPTMRNDVALSSFYTCLFIGFFTRSSFCEKKHPTTLDIIQWTIQW